jgi:hypothetical protein
MTFHERGHLTVSSGKGTLKKDPSGARITSSGKNAPGLRVVTDNSILHSAASTPLTAALDSGRDRMLMNNITCSNTPLTKSNISTIPHCGPAYAMAPLTPLDVSMAHYPSNSITNKPPFGPCHNTLFSPCLTSPEKYSPDSQTPLWITTLQLKKVNARTWSVPGICPHLSLVSLDVQPNTCLIPRPLHP